MTTLTARIPDDRPNTVIFERNRSYAGAMRLQPNFREMFPDHFPVLRQDGVVEISVIGPERHKEVKRRTVAVWLEEGNE